jgi:hypothetical protein
MIFRDNGTIVLRLISSDVIDGQRGWYKTVHKRADPFICSGECGFSFLDWQSLW